MANVRCAAVVYWGDTILLVRDRNKRLTQKWRLPERVLAEHEEVTQCARRGVFAQTGYRPMALQLLRIACQPKTNKSEQFIRFVFGCHIEPAQLHVPTQYDVGTFTTDAVLQLSYDNKFDDSVLLHLIHSYKVNAPIAPSAVL